MNHLQNAKNLDVPLTGKTTKTLDDILHFGVKGMKWGVRKDVVGSYDPTGREPSGLSSMGKPPSASDRKASEYYNNSLEKHFSEKWSTNVEPKLLDYLEKHPKSSTSSPDFAKKYADVLNYEVASVLGSIDPNIAFATKTYPDGSVRTYYGDEKSLRNYLQRFELGHSDTQVVKTLTFEIPDSDLKPTVEATSDILLASSINVLHFGIKGMKWGVRKDRKSGGKEPLTKDESVLRYRRLAADAANSKNWSDDDLAFFTRRSEQINKVSKHAQTNESEDWASSAAKRVLKQTAEKRLADFAGNVSKRYLDKLMADSPLTTKQLADKKIKELKQNAEINRLIDEHFRGKGSRIGGPGRRIKP